MPGNVRKNIDILNAIVALSKEITLTSSFTDLIDNFVHLLTRTFPFKHVVVWTLNEELKKFLSAYSTIPLKHDILPEEDSMIIHSSRNNKNTVINDFRKEKRFMPFIKDANSAIAIPLASFGKVRGVLYIESHSKNYFDRKTITYLSILSSQFGIALRNHHLFGQINSMKNYLDTLVEKTNAIMIITDALGRIQRVNEAAERFFGYRRDDLYLTLVFNLLSNGAKKRGLLPHLSDIRNGKFISGIELEIITNNGEKKYGIFNLGGIHETEKKLKEIIIMGQDITNSKETEMKLIQAEKMALLGQISASIVHEINNPLALVSSYAQVLRIKANNEKREDEENKLNVILNCVDKLQKIIRNLMKFGMPASDEVSQVDLNQSIEEALKWIEHMARKGNVHIIKNMTPDIPKVVGNKTEIQQVFLNLISNSLQSMDKRVGKIEIRTLKDDKYIIMEIIDEGEGIAVGNMKRIFEPFFTTKLPDKGTGLGLSIVRRIVERHNGKIIVKSKKNMGTRVRILLPCVAESRR